MPSKRNLRIVSNRPDPTLWSDLAIEYGMREVSFPMEAVMVAVFGDLVEKGFSTVLWTKTSLRGRTYPYAGGATAERLAEAVKALSALPSDTLDDQEDIILELKYLTFQANMRKRAADNEEWVITPEGELKAKQVGGAENCPEMYLNILIRRVYNALRPAYDRAWPEYAGDQNTRLIREHIARIIRPLGLIGVDLLPSSRRPIDRAIDYELRKRKI